MAYGVHPVKTGPLSRDRVLQGAVALADEQGLAAVSMRPLAERLGVVPMALYKHVAGKEDLLAGMIDAVVASYPTPATNTGWQARLRERVLGARRVLRQHPWLRSALESATVRTPTVLAYMDAVAGDLIDDGLSLDLTHYALHAMGYRIWGFSPEAFATPARESSAEPASVVEQTAMLEQMSRVYPHVTAIAVESATRNPAGACDDDGEFAFALDLLLDAVARLHETGWRSTSG